VTDVIYLEVGAGARELCDIHTAMNSNSLAFHEPFAYHPHVTLAQDISHQDVPDTLKLASGAGASSAASAVSAPSGPCSYRAPLATAGSIWPNTSSPARLLICEIPFSLPPLHRYDNSLNTRLESGGPDFSEMRLAPSPLETWPNRWLKFLPFQSITNLDVRVHAVKGERLVTIAVCDTEPIAIEGLRGLLLESAEELRVVAAESTLADGMDAVRELRPALLLVDKALGIHAVLDWLTALRRMEQRPAVIVWGAALSESEALRILQAGRPASSARLPNWIR